MASLTPLQSIKNGFSLLELLITIAILSIIATGVMTAFSLLNDGINEQIAQREQRDQFYGIKNLLDIDFGYHNLGVATATPLCFLDYNNTHTPTWQSSCVNAHTEATFSTTSDAVLACANIPSSNTVRKVAYFFDTDANTVCRHQWTHTSCDGDPETGADSLASSYPTAQCTNGLLSNVAETIFQYLPGASTEVRFNFSAGIGSNDITTVEDNFSALIQSRPIPDDVPIVDMVFAEYDVVDNSNIRIAISLLEPATQDLTFELASGDLSCTTPCAVVINKGTDRGFKTMSDPLGADSLAPGDTTLVSIKPSNDYVVGSNYTAAITVTSSSDVVTPTVSLSSSQYTLSDSGQNVTVKVELSEKLALPLDVTLSLTGLDCGASEHYLILQAVVTDCIADGNTTATVTLASGTLSQSFTLSPQTLPSTQANLNLVISTANNMIIDDTPIILQTIVANDRPLVTMTSPDTSVFTPHASSADTVQSDLVLNFTPVLTETIDVSLTKSGTLTCGTDYTITGLSCAADATVSIPAGTAIKRIPVTFIYHADNNHNETALFTVTSHSTLRLASDVTMTFTVKELSKVSFASASHTINLAGSYSVPLTISPAASQDLVITFTGNNHSTHYTLPSSISINAGSTSASLVLTGANIDSVVDTTSIVIDEVIGKGVVGIMGSATVLVN